VSVDYLLGAMKNAPVGYECPFCRVAESLPTPAPESCVVLVEPRVFAFVPLHRYADIRGNCLVAPRLHYENALDIPDNLGSDFFRVTRLLASAMKEAFSCEGVSTRQHNGPAGDQDVWHFHLHVFPRFLADGLWGGHKTPYTTEERLELAARLRAVLR
jgi:histidine triad (HIT) family protein